MSYALAFAPDTQTQWQELDPWLQEIVLDEADAVAIAPPAEAEVVYRDLLRIEAGKRHYLFLRFTVDHVHQRVTLIGIVHFTRAES